MLPCGFIGTKYTSPPELSLDKKYYELSFQEIRAHDIWSLGVVLYDWYIIKDGENIVDLHFDNGTELKKDTLRYLSQNEINNRIEKIKNNVAKQVLLLMLRVDWKERISNWNEVLIILFNEKEIEK
jgi:serine/threonine protein kinase